MGGSLTCTKLHEFLAQSRALTAPAASPVVHGVLLGLCVKSVEGQGHYLLRFRFGSAQAG
mgnify:CR=1 FL=1